MNVLAVFSILAIIAILIYYFFMNGKWNPLKTICSCPSCPMDKAEAQQVLSQLAQGCTERLRAVMRESEATIGDVEAFMTGGSNRLVIVTNLGPDEFVGMIHSGDLSRLQAVAMSSNLSGNGEKSYIVMSMTGGKISPIGSPTLDFVSAFSYLDISAKGLGTDTENLVFYIDEDLPCSSVTPIDNGVSEESTNIEGCCGARFQVQQN